MSIIQMTWQMRQKILRDLQNKNKNRNPCSVSEFSKFAGKKVNTHKKSQLYLYTLAMNMWILKFKIKYQLQSLKKNEVLRCDTNKAHTGLILKTKKKITKLLTLYTHMPDTCNLYI